MNEIKIVNTDCFEIASGTSLTGSIEAQKGDYIIATISVRSELTLPDTLTLLKKSDQFGDENQTMSFAYEKAETDGTYSYTVLQSTAGRIYINLIVIRGIKEIKYTGKFYNISNTYITSSNMITPAQKEKGNILIWGCSANKWKTSSNYGNWAITPNDLQMVCLDSSKTQPRQANFIDLGEGAETHSFYPNAADSYGSPCVVDAVELIPFQSKYLISDGRNYYNVSSGVLNKLEITELTAYSFISYGNDEIPDGSLLLNLSNPSVMCWTDAEELPVITANVTATPQSQNVISNSIDLTHKSITGIESATANCEGELIIAVSFDGKQTWKAWNGSEWSTLSEEFTGMNKETLEAITFEQWNLLFTGASSFYIRVSLIDTTQSVTEIIVDFAN